MEQEGMFGAMQTSFIMSSWQLHSCMLFASIHQTVDLKLVNVYF